MSEDHKKTILHFLSFPGMYIQNIDEVNITSFLTGYQIGTNHVCDFTIILSKHLEENLKIPKLSTGWPGQVMQYSQNENLSWVSAFKKLATAVL